MVWIATVPEEEATGNLKRYYEGSRAKNNGKISVSMKIYSLREGHVRAAEVMRSTVMEGPGDLSPTERQAVAVRVSALNNCHF